MVADSALKLDNANVTFVDPGVQMDETYLILFPIMCKVSAGSSYLSRKISPAHKTR